MILGGLSLPAFGASLIDPTKVLGAWDFDAGYASIVTGSPLGNIDNTNQFVTRVSDGQGVGGSTTVQGDASHFCYLKTGIITRTINSLSVSFFAGAATGGGLTGGNGQSAGVFLDRDGTLATQNGLPSLTSNFASLNANANVDVAGLTGDGTLAPLAKAANGLYHYCWTINLLNGQFRFRRSDGKDASGTKGTSWGAMTQFQGVVYLTKAAARVDNVVFYDGILSDAAVAALAAGKMPNAAGLLFA